MRNYLFACLESEARLALLAFGLDPSLGVLHADQRNRDSLALDAMEPVRGDVDAFLLDLLEDRIFTARDFGELPNGVCRIAAPLTHELGLTLPHWRGLVQPIAARLAQLFRNAATGTNAKRPASVKSPLVVTPRKASQPHPYAGKAWSTPRLETLPKAAASCELCSGPVLKRRRRHCEACIPKVRRAHGLRVIEAARKALAVQAAEGNDPRASDRAGRKRGEAISEQHRQNRAWVRGATAGRDAAWFLREIVPKLDGYSLSQIAKATGLSLAACSRIRAGARVPHPRHWKTLGLLVKTLG